MTLTNILSLLLTEKKEVTLSTLPSQGLFYPKDMKLKIKKAEPQDIIHYESTIDRHNMIKSIDSIKTIVERNVILNKKYSFIDLKSVDIVFLFLEIVKFTKGKPILIKYTSEVDGQSEVAFSAENFNYFDFSSLMEFYDDLTREFIIEGYHYSFPSIGVENSLASFLSNITEKEKLQELQKISYDFLFFLTGKSNLTIDEIDNLIQIFNYDLEEEERNKVSNIIKMFSDILSYSLKANGKVIEMKYMLNLETIWNI